MKPVAFAFTAFYLISFNFSALQVNAQGVKPGTDTIQSEQSQVKAYVKELGENARLYVGSEYEPFPLPITDGHVFFDSAEWQAGWLSYNGLVYQSLLLKYDLVQDKIISTYSNQNLIFQVINQKVDSFMLGTHYFINLRAGSGSAALKPGIYEIRGRGKGKLYISRVKTIEEQIRDRTLERRINLSSHFFYLSNSIFHEISSQKELMRLLARPPRQVKAFLRSLHLKFRKDPELTLLRMIEFNDGLTAPASPSQQIN